jgi:transposase
LTEEKDFLITTQAKEIKEMRGELTSIKERDERLERQMEQRIGRLRKDIDEFMQDTQILDAKLAGNYKFWDSQID